MSIRAPSLTDDRLVDIIELIDDTPLPTRDEITFLVPTEKNPDLRKLKESLMLRWWVVAGPRQTAQMAHEIRRLRDENERLRERVEEQNESIAELSELAESNLDLLDVDL